MNKTRNNAFDLSLEERVHIAPLLREEGGEAVSFPLSIAQQSIWYPDQLLAGVSRYNLSRAFRLRGSLRVDALEWALDQIVFRHESLRTTFAALDRGPAQYVTASGSIPLSIIDLSSYNETIREVKLQRFINEEARRPFDLDLGPLLGAVLLRLGPDENVLQLTFHQIIADEQSIKVFCRELSLLYGTYCSGELSPLPDLPVQYRDFVERQRQWLQSEMLEVQLAYWKKKLAGSTFTLQLPADNPRPADLSYRGSIESLALPGPLTEALKKLSEQESVSLSTTLLAAFQVLLYRYTDQEDICLGYPIANRNRRESRNCRESEGLIGLLVNTLVLRTDLSGNPGFRELLARVHEVVQEACACSDLPYERLMQELDQDRGSSRTPLFQVMFSLLEDSLEALDLQRVTVSPVDVHNGAASVDLSLCVKENARGLIGSFEYSTDLFDAATIAKMVENFQTLLDGIVANPDQPISELPLLAEAERQRLLVEWNNTLTEYPRNKCLHQLFEEQAADTPDAVAVVFEDEQLTYRQLNERGNQLARYLQRLGVSPDVLVGICLERSLDMMVALLGILKAGGAYVPLDPNYPQERLAFISDDANTPVLLTQKALADRLRFHKSSLVCVDQDLSAIARESKENPINSATPENLAYVMYTSGSTGRPKGVMVSHRAVVRLVRDTNYANLNPEEVFLQLAPISFDASTFEIWGSLLNGAKLAILPPQIPSLEELGRAIERYQVTTLWLTAGLFNAMVEQRLNDLRPLGQLLAGGDVLSPSHVLKALHELKQCRLINGYGPTEGATFTCCYTVGSNRSSERVPIGQPISNTQVYLLDPNLQPVPIGVPGELCIGGAGLARGYLNQPELTAEKFIPDPLSSEPDARLYKTGDLARYLPDGNIDFLGRADNQIKLLGFRIEPEEIEAALCQHPAVREVVVLARKDSCGDKRLVAYVAPTAQPALSKSELRGYLQDKLPFYMVPSVFVLLDNLPLSPNGKVDRRALPVPDSYGPELEESFIAPRTETEQAISNVWQKVLLVEKVGMDDNFFDLGGDSLQLIEVHSELQRLFNFDLSITDLFQYSTVSSLAEHLREGLTVSPPFKEIQDRARLQKEALARQKQSKTEQCQ